MVNLMARTLLTDILLSNTLEKPWSNLLTLSNPISEQTYELKIHQLLFLNNVLFISSKVLGFLNVFCTEKMDFVCM